MMLYVGCGMIKLPSDKTEYSHLAGAKGGCKTEHLDMISAKLKNCNHNYQVYHVLVFDEMYLSKDLVFCKSTGQIVG